MLRSVLVLLLISGANGFSPAIPLLSSARAILPLSAKGACGVPMAGAGAGAGAGAARRQRAAIPIMQLQKEDAKADTASNDASSGSLQRASMDSSMLGEPPVVQAQGEGAAGFSYADFARCVAHPS
jgi:hypothetical protein